MLKPSVDLPQQFAAATSSQGESEVAWWEGFKDPILSDLIKRAAEKKPVPRSRPERLKEGKKRLEQELELERRVRADYRAWRACG